MADKSKAEEWWFEEETGVCWEQWTE